MGPSEEQGVLEVPVDGFGVIPTRVTACEVGIAGRTRRVRWTRSRRRTGCVGLADLPRRGGGDSERGPAFRAESGAREIVRASPRSRMVGRAIRTCSGHQPAGIRRISMCSSDRTRREDARRRAHPRPIRRSRTSSRLPTLRTSRIGVSPSAPSSILSFRAARGEVGRLD